LKKILVADDERALRMLIAGTLEIGDFKVLEADNGVDALKMAKDEKPDLAILDVMMPGMTGYEVCRYIKSDMDLKDIKVLILTAKGQQSDREAALEYNADYYMPKPFSPAELLEIVENMFNI
jgi:DNA-binding response OmpR family regulator